MFTSIFIFWSIFLFVISHYYVFLRFIIVELFHSKAAGGIQSPLPFFER